MPESYEPFDWSSTTPIDEATLDAHEAQVEVLDDRITALEAIIGSANSSRAVAMALIFGG